MKSMLPPLRPLASAKLFVFGATVGPIVDSLHNQCLLRYEFAPIHVSWPEALPGLKTFLEQEYLLSSSWSVPLLLGFAYVVLGDILPRVFQWILNAAIDRRNESLTLVDSPSNKNRLQTRAVVAVFTTAAIIKASQYLELHQPFDSLVSVLPSTAQANYAVLMFAALMQWYVLDGSFAALLAAAVTSIGGPLSELPFVANHIWTYLPQATDYFPLANIPDSWKAIARLIGGDKYQQLGISSITGPCYFAVTMDAIALSRYFTTGKDDEASP